MENLGLGRGAPQPEAKQLKYESLTPEMLSGPSRSKTWGLWELVNSQDPAKIFQALCTLKKASETVIIDDKVNGRSSERKHGGEFTLFSFPGVEKMKTQEYLVMRSGEEMFTMDAPRRVALQRANPADPWELDKSILHHYVIVVRGDAIAKQIKLLRVGIYIDEKEGAPAHM